MLRSLIAAIAFALLAQAPSAGAATLKIATIVPDGSSWLVEMRKAGKKIQERTEGRVKLKFYPGGVMGSDKTVMRKVRARQLHGGAFTAGALSSVFPDVELYSLPLLFRNYEEVDHVRSTVDEILKKGLSDNGFEALAITDGGFAHLLSRAPVRDVGGLAQRKVWIVEDDIMSQTALDIAGVAPVPLPIADVYTALQTGLVDTVAAPAPAAIAFQWHTKVDYLTDEPLMYLIGIFALDKRSFDRLGPADQEILREEVASAAKRLDAEGRVGEESARAALQKQGVEFVEASSAEEVERWHAISQQALEKLRTLGRYDEAIIQTILDRLAEVRATSAAGAGMEGAAGAGMEGGESAAAAAVSTEAE